MKPFITLMVAAMLFSFILAGCSKVNRENYDRIKVGMEYQQVTELIGNPDKCDAALGMKNCIWGTESKNITIQFVAEKVVLPSMKGL
nr:DUF3862 domain-containing protein [Desulfobacula sp.]